MKGILLIDKEPGWTSSDVVAKLRGMLNVKRIGHSGTLDPMASGLQVVFIGRATKAVEYAENHSKHYIAKLRPGICTDTEDITGNIISRSEPDFTDEQLTAVLESFRGEIEQIPPMYSAIKINGQKLYKMARNGENIRRQPRRICIHSLRLAGKEGGDYILDVSCSKGTYIRSLCRDIGEKLGCGACMSALRRTEAGCFSVSDAYKIDDVQKAKDEGRAEELLLPLDSLFAQYPDYTVNSRDENFIRSGCPPRCHLEEGIYRVYSRSGEFIALSHIRNGRLETLKKLF